MKHIVIPNSTHEPLHFYLAVEEWVADNLPEDKYFFAWQVAPTVICGRHQDVAAEVSLQFAANNGIAVVRRKSGGGAVYADFNNVMFSYITPSDAVQTTFGDYTSMISEMLRSLNIKAEPTGRNDIAINGRKVAGNAFFKKPARSIVHGTMLYDADFDTMSKVLTPSRAKQISKGVLSVESRVTTLCAEGLKMPCCDFVDYAVNFLCEGEYVLSESELAEVREIMKTYQTVFSDNSAAEHQVYIDGVGAISLHFDCDERGVINGVEIFGDFFPLVDACAAFARAFVGHHISEAREIADALPIGEIIAGMSPEKMKQLLPNT